jgi:RNA polymerase sigma-70 factor (ECF subfamily)
VISGQSRVENIFMAFHFTDPALFILRATPVTESGNGRDRIEEEIVTLFDQLRGPLLRYLSSFGVALPDGEEVIQEAFLSLYQHMRDGKPRDNLRGWLFRVAQNLALKQRYRTQRSLDASGDPNLFENTAIDPAPNPEDRLVNQVTQQRLLAVVGALPEQDRRCLSLRAEGLRYREIGEILDISLGAVSLSLARSLARIARAAER